MKIKMKIKIKLILFIIIHHLCFISCMPPIINIGAIFSKDQKDSSTVLAFKYGINKINNDKTLLPSTEIIYNIQYVPNDDSFHAGKIACAQIDYGIQALFGPSNKILGVHIHSICDALDIPYFEIRLDLYNYLKEISINLYPAQNLFNAAFKDVIKYFNWTKIAIIYEKDYGMIKLRELMHTTNIELIIIQADPLTFDTVLEELKTKEIHNIIVDLTLSNHMILFLRGIIKHQMNEYKYHYFFTSLDIDTFDLDDFKYNFVNITAFRLVDVDDIGVRETLKDMDNYYNENNYTFLQNSNVIETESALMYDSLHIFAIGLQTLEQSQMLRLTNVSCDEEKPWDIGLSLINYINTVQWKGLTGPIELKDGKRVQFKLDLVKLKQHTIIKVGEWTPNKGLNITDRSLLYDTSSINVTLLVVTILEVPYVMMHYNKNYTGNERFYGYCIDILERVSQEVGFEYILDVVPDKKYGAKDPITGEWNGMVAQLMKNKADLAVGSMTINYARESVIDFTKPFMNLGISILFKEPEIQPTRLFSFMNPLAIDIWFYCLTAYILVSMTMYVVAHLSPYEWHYKHPCEQDNQIVENQFTIANSFWFTIGTLMQQGSDLNPKAVSTRIVGGIWWFFTLIIISSYTANLAAFLTVERMITPIENAEDLAEQTDIAYGTLESGSTMTFFRDSKIGIYQKMWRFMDSKKETLFVNKYEDGIKKVLEGNYAFLMESTMLDYAVQRDCNLTQIGGLLDSKGYGIATPKGSPWRDKISLAILELQEKGYIQILYDKWWKNTGDVCFRIDKAKESKVNALGVENIGGVFVVLLCGLVFAILVAILEFCYNSKKNAQTDRQSLCAEMTEELRFAIRCHGSRQRPALKRSCNKCHPSTTTSYVASGSGIDMTRLNQKGSFNLQTSPDLAETVNNINTLVPSLTNLDVTNNITTSNDLSSNYYLPECIINDNILSNSNQCNYNSSNVEN